MSQTDAADKRPSAIEAAREDPPTDMGMTPKWAFDLIQRRASQSDLEILRALAESERGGLTAREIGEQISCSNRTTRRRVRVMTDETPQTSLGLLKRDPDDKTVWFTSERIAREAGAYFDPRRQNG